MFILDATLIQNTCSDPVLARILSLVHLVFQIICIIAPILLIVSAVVGLISLLANPDQKNGTKKVVMKFFAAVMIFFLPWLTDLVINLVPGNSFSISACWNYADEKNEQIGQPIFGAWSSSTNGSLSSDLALLEKYYGNTTGESGGTGDNKGDVGSYNPASCKAQVLTGGQRVPIYYQNNPNCDWGSFNSSETVADSGCGFTSVAMILTYLTGSEITPTSVVNRYKDSYFQPGSGMRHSLAIQIANDYNLSVSSTNSASSVVNALKEGRVVLARGPESGYSGGLFSSGGHFIVLRGIDDSGKIYVNNPNYYRQDENTQGFTINQIDAWATNYWTYAAR